MTALRGSVLAAVLLLVVPATANAAGTVDGCDVYLTHPTAVWAEFHEADTEGWLEYEVTHPEDAEVGYIDLRLVEGQGQLPPGDWTVIWMPEGGSESFVLDCATDELAMPETSTLAPAESGIPVGWVIVLGLAAILGAAIGAVDASPRR